MKFEKVLDATKYQVFLFTCPAILPFSFARHPWLVINKKGEVSRWEVFWQPVQLPFAWKHLHRDYYEPAQGIEMFYGSQKYHFTPKLMGYIEGDEHSLAARMVAFIEDTPKQYPFWHTYKLRGPNSNTFVQWVINRFPESGFTLPWNSFGKNYRPTVR